MSEKGIYTRFVRYVSLHTLSMIGLSCYILADTFFIARGMGADGLTALNLIIPVYSLINATGLMIGIGAATRYSVLKAQGKDREANGVFTHASVFGLGAGMFFLACGLLFPNVLAKLMGADADTFGMTCEYLKTLMSFSPLFILNNTVNAFVRNDRSPGLAMAAMFFGCLFNIVFDYVLIFPCGLGMFGAALATGCSPAVGLLILSVHCLKRKNGFHVQRTGRFFKDLKITFSLGFPAFINELSSGVVILAFNFVLLGISGNRGVAAYGVVANLAIVAVSVLTGAAQGVQPMISTCCGANDLFTARRLMKLTSAVCVLLAAVIYAVSFVFRTPITALFNSEGDAALAVLAERGIVIYFSGFLFAGLNITFSSFFTAVQRPKPAFLISVLRGFAAVLPLLFLLSALLGTDGVWLSYTAAEAVTLAVGLFLLKHNI